MSRAFVLSRAAPLVAPLCPRPEPLGGRGGRWSSGASGVAVATVLWRREPRMGGYKGHMVANVANRSLFWSNYCDLTPPGDRYTQLSLECT